jgi:hypothetical protein
MTNRTPWQDTENGGLVCLYFTMLDAAEIGDQYSKAALIRYAQSSGENVGIPNDYHGLLADRSRGSIEFKLMNASAAHADIAPNATTMHGYGYRAMPNYQASLKVAMRDEIDRRRTGRWIDGAAQA